MNEIRKIRADLNLNTDEWIDLDDDLIELSFIPRQANNNKYMSLINRINSKYGQKDHELLEFLGDTVLEMIITSILYDEYIINNNGKYTNVNESLLTNYRIQLVKNTTLYCHMKRKNLCSYVKTNQRSIKIKQCADSLEAIVGVLYYHLHYIKKDPTALGPLPPPSGPQGPTSESSSSSKSASHARS